MAKARSIVEALCGAGVTDLVGLPDNSSAARRLLNMLAELPYPLEAFDRVAAGIAEAYEGR